MRHSNLWFIDFHGQRSINTQICVAECQPPRVVGHFAGDKWGCFFFWFSPTVQRFPESFESQMKTSEL